MGSLLTGSLIILPAAIGRRLTNKMSHFLIASCLASTLSVGAGFLLNTTLVSQIWSRTLYRHGCSLIICDQPV